MTEPPGRRRSSRTIITTTVLGTVVVLVLVAVVAYVAVDRSTTTLPGRSPSPGSSGSPSPPVPPNGTSGGISYSVSGHEILANEKPFVPYGITVFGLAYPDWQAHEAGDLAQIESSASTWRANTVRIQVSPKDLLGNSPYDTAYLAATTHAKFRREGLST